MLMMGAVGGKKVERVEKVRLWVVGVGMLLRGIIILLGLIIWRKINLSV